MNQSPSSDPLSVPLLDLGRENGPLREQVLQAVARVCDSGRFLFGPDVQQLEDSIAELCGVKHAIGCASGSDALLLAMMALDVGPQDEVIVPSFTFFATASCIWRLGARPVFVDIEPVTFNLDPQRVEEAVTSATKAIVPVDLFGQCAAWDRLKDIAARHELHLVEDAAQAIGAEFRGRAAGAWGDVGCFSFYPTKNLGGFGDGGMLTTDRAELAEKLRLLASHGMKPRYYHSVVGINSRLDSIQAAVLNVKLKHLPRATSRRMDNAARYHEMFCEAGLDQILGLPQTAAQRRHVWNQYTIRIPGGRRDALRASLQDRRISTEIYYPVPLHLQQCFHALGYQAGSLPETERAADEVLSLPVFPELGEHEQRAVVQGIADFLETQPQTNAA